MADGVDFSNSASRETSAEAAGSDFESQLGSMRDFLDDSEDGGTSLGGMVKTQLGLTEAETKYAVSKGLPEKATKTVSTVSQKIAQAAG